MGTILPLGTAPISSPYMIHVSGGRALHRGQRLGLVDDEDTEHLQRLIAWDLGVVQGAGRDRIGTSELEVFIGLALDGQVERAPENVADLDAGMGVRGRVGARLDFNDAGVDGATIWKIDLLQ